MNGPHSCSKQSSLCKLWKGSVAFMTQQHALHFPDDFLWGTASSSYQCEGGNTNNQWYRWEQQGRILSGEQCGVAANWWQAAESDFALAEQMENSALRLSRGSPRADEAGPRPPDDGRGVAAGCINQAAIASLAPGCRGSDTAPFYRAALVC